MKFIISIILALVATTALANGRCMSRQGYDASKDPSCKPPPAVVPILMYHRINDSFPPGETVVPTLRFIEHLQAIKEAGLRTMTVTELANQLARGQTPRNSVVITFDDGRDDNYVAAKLLAQQGMKATFYITTSFLDTPGYLKTSQLRELAQSFEIGAHSHTHYLDRNLETIPETELLGEAAMSKFILQSLLNKPINSYAWPFGHFRFPLMPSMAALGFTNTVLVSQEAGNHHGISTMTLQRINIDGRCTAGDLKEMLQSATIKMCK